MMAGWVHIKCLTHKTLGFSTHKAKENPNAAQDAVACSCYCGGAPDGSRHGLSTRHARNQLDARESGDSGKPALININTADEAQLTSLQGIGPTKAKAITQYRQEHGPFKTVDDLKKVSGIGDKTLASLKPFITVGP